MPTTLFFQRISRRVLSRPAQYLVQQDILDVLVRDQTGVSAADLPLIPKHALYDRISHSVQVIYVVKDQFG